MRFKLLRRHNRNSVSITIFLSILMISFNNCSQVGFSSSFVRSVASTTGTDAASTVITPTDPSPSEVAPSSPIVTQPAPVGLAFTTPGALITPTLAVSGTSISIQATLKPTLSASGLSVDLELRDSLTQKSVAKKVFTNQSFTAGTIASYIWVYDMPSTLPIGNYYLTVAVFDAAFKTTYIWNNNAASLLVMASALAKPKGALSLVGVNISGAEFNNGKEGARLFHDYIYPSTAEIDNLASKGMKVVRLPFSIIRMQPKLNSALNAAELSALDGVVQYANSKGVTIVLDPHNYGYMNTDAGKSALIGVDPEMPAANFADFWKRMASFYAKQPNVMFNLMNEPHSQTAIQWRDAAIPAIKAIRATGATQKILIPGTSWTGAHSWISSGNAAAWAGFTDMNFSYEVHQYLDSDFSGRDDACVAKLGAKILASFTDWARANKVQGFLGEAGWHPNSNCLLEGEAMLGYMGANNDVWLGITYFASGPWMGSYHYSVEPIWLGTNLVIERPQTQTLLRYVK